MNYRLDLCPDEQDVQNVQPLSDKIRPTNMQEIIGQSISNQIFGLNSNGIIQSMIFWGPPGSGKTSMAKLLAKESGINVEELSAVMHATAKFRSVFQSVTSNQYKKIILIMDEIHHLNKSQQDVFLPYLENGSVILIGTTTENPSFELRPALLSRCKVIVFERLDIDALEKILLKAEGYVSKKLPLTSEARRYLCVMCDGDARYLLNRAEELFSLSLNEQLAIDELKNFVTSKASVYDKGGEEHYNLLSAFHKSLRGSDVDAALYWANRMLLGGENPLTLTRRLITFASEDVGLADPGALKQALNAHEAYSILGSPEGKLAIMNAVIYLASSPKSNAGYVAYKEAKKCAEHYGSLPVPYKIRNAPTKLMSDLQYGNGYIYDHDTKHAFAGQDFFPEQLKRQKFYIPVERGFEREIKKRIDWYDQMRKSKK